MNHTQGTLQGYRSLSLYYQSWRPNGQVNAALALVHGFGEHSGRYAHVGDALASCGYAVYAVDLRGHGRSPGPRGYVERWADFRQDAGALVRMVAMREPGLPLFLYGHSLGGLIALEYALREPGGLRGVIASSPMLGQAGVSPVLFTLSQVLSHVWPSFSMNVRLDTSMLSRDPAVAAAYRADPLVHGIGSARLGSECTVALEWVQAHAREMTLPLLLIQGCADRLTVPEGGLRFYGNAASADKQLGLYEGAYHEVHNDECKEQMLADLVAWLDRHR
jgi:alpha-beta hydrolase superfamily lysophospholipase